MQQFSAYPIYLIIIAFFAPILEEFGLARLRFRSAAAEMERIGLEHDPGRYLSAVASADLLYPRNLPVQPGNRIDSVLDIVIKWGTKTMIVLDKDDIALDTITQSVYPEMTAK